MSKLLLNSLVVASAVTLAAVAASGEEPTQATRGTMRSKADHPPRKVVVGTVIFGPYGQYSGLDERLKELCGLVDAMADEAKKASPGRGLDLAVLPETTVTDTRGPASQRAIPLKGPVLETFAALAQSAQDLPGHPTRPG